jgi:hypothetical protein
MSHTVEHIVGKMPVVVENPYPDIDTAFVLNRLEAALDLIARFQPIRMQHFRRDVRLIHVVRFPCRGAFLHEGRVVITELTFLHKAAQHPDGEVASSILHEGVHARVFAMTEHLGFERTWSMADEERLCRRAELAFGHALPPALAAPVIARAAMTLATTDDESVAPTIDWRQAERNQQTADIERMGGTMRQSWWERLTRGLRAHGE